MTLQVDVAHSSIPRSTVSCIHYHKKYSPSYLGISSQLFIAIPSIQAKCSLSSQTAGFSSEPWWENRWETLQGNEATEEENGNLQETKKKAGLPLCSQTLPPPLTSATDPLSILSVLRFPECHLNGILKYIIFGTGVYHWHNTFNIIHGFVFIISLFLFIAE